jgi:hypothetical protein
MMMMMMMMMMLMMTMLVLIDTLGVFVLVVQAIPQVFEDRLLFYRERAAGVYGAFAYWATCASAYIPQVHRILHHDDDDDDGTYDDDDDNDNRDDDDRSSSS